MLEQFGANGPDLTQALNAIDHEAARARAGDARCEGEAGPIGGALQDEVLAEAKAVGAVVERIYLESQRCIEVEQSFCLAVNLSGKYCVKKRSRLRHCPSPR
ncbi:MAG: hypothetical protein J0I99_13800 [Devosia sp.]|uniref:hypothetical protein n=1 Tax=Devosia sp. TaxID=1871048 RepID=UPI001AC9E1D3|nr:hypothetical protein [Devosia sp.]MBN9316811.1 hypothetical protein [Devosia sp.]